MARRISFFRASTAAVIFLLVCIAFANRVFAEWDYIVVGAGASGCALSSQLASDASKSVLVLEAGGPMGWDFGGREQRDHYRLFGGNSNVTIFDVPAEAVLLLADGVTARPEFYWNTVPWGVQGKGVGGSGGLNNAVSFTGSPEDFETWPEGWAYGDMKPFYKEVLEATSVGAVTSADGELYLQAPGDLMNEVLKNQLGFKEAPLNGSPVRVNTSSLTEFYSKGGQRLDSCKAFLLPALNTKDNIKLEVNSLVKRVMFSKSGLASGVELENGRVFHLNEGGKVVSTAGPLNTPKLLMYSGIGPASELERLDKNGLVHNPRELWIFNEEVGASLHDHPNIPLIAQVPDTLKGTEFLINFTDTQIFVDYFNRRSGPLAQHLNPRVAFLAMPGKPAPDFEIGALNVNIFTCPTCLQFFVLSLKPTAKTMLKINTPDLGCSCGAAICKTEDFCSPDIYFATEKDLNEMVWALSTFIGALESEGFEVTFPPSKHPAFLQAWLANQEAAPSAWHYAGTCSLGRCTDANLKVKGTENVYVADTSVFPDPIRTHNSITAMAVGRKAASHAAK